MPPKEYLGDSVYASYDGHVIELTTENGRGASNLIVLAPDVIAALLCYVEVIRATHAACAAYKEANNQ